MKPKNVDNQTVKNKQKHNLELKEGIVYLLQIIILINQETRFKGIKIIMMFLS